MEYLFKNISYLDPYDGEKRNMYLGVDGGNISYLSSEAPEEEAGRVIDGKNKLLIPGLKNTHTHIPMAALRGVCDDKNLNDWLFGRIIPYENRLTPRMIEISSQVGMLEAIAGGTTAINEMYYRISLIARSAKMLGLRMNICNAILSTENFDENDRGVQETKEIVAEYPNDELIKPVIGVHSVHTTYEPVWKWVREFSQDHPLPIMMHMAEAKVDVETCKNLFGDTPAAILEKNGIFANKALIAHGVWVDDRDLEILKRNNVSFSHCPVSNLKLASGIAPVTEYLKHGINVTIGTDGVASNNSLDMFSEMKYAVLLQRYLKLDATVLTASDVFRFATVNACDALGIENCGRIKAGYKADLAMLDLDRPGLIPARDLLSNMIYCANAADVKLTMINGRIVYENGQYPGIDHEKIMSEFCNEIIPELEA